MTGKTICIISNSHSANDVRLYHKLAKSLVKIARVYVLAARGSGSLMESLDKSSESEDSSNPKPVRIIVSGLTPNLRLFGLYKHAIKLHPELVICVEPLTLLVGVYLKNKTGCRLVYDAHEYYAAAHAEKYTFPFNYLFGALYNLFERSLQQKMDLTLAVNEDIFMLFNLTKPPINKPDKEDTAKMETLFPSKKHWGIICPNYPTREIFKEDITECITSTLIPDMQFDTVYLGGLTEERGIIKLLQVINLLRTRHPLFKALFVGPFHSEAFRQKFFTYLMDNNLNSNVYWRDAVPHDKVCAIMSQVKVGLSVLHPAYKRYKKALPLKVLEYLAVGIPVVANDFPQIREIIEKHSLGYCVPFHKQEIADAIDKLLLLTPGERKTLADKSRELISRHYLWSRVEPELLATMSYLLKLGKR